ncbi:DUF4366 domain-containing protein [Carnobacteriaceae bacterium zg-ZUI78]|nr:DUF4366 domain-containing protein [Carnobacteriaceae bacterium zg-ZUI78]
MKEQFKKIILVFTLCFMAIPVSVYASEKKEVEKDFTIEVSKEDVTKENSFTVDVVEDTKENKKANLSEKEHSEKTIDEGNKGVTKEEMKELLENYSKNSSNNSPILATPQSKARGTSIENVGADNKEYPIRRDIVSKSTTSKSDSKNNTTQSKERPSSDARQFLTFKTKSGKVFHLIINHDQSSDNVQLVTEVSERDLLNMIETKEIKEMPKQEVKQETKEEVKKEPKKQDNSLGSYFILGLVLLGALGVGYYFKIIKPKQEKDFDFEEDENDDEFFEENQEEVKEEEDENI